MEANGLHFEMGALLEEDKSSASSPPTPWPSDFEDAHTIGGSSAILNLSGGIRRPPFVNDAVEFFNKPVDLYEGRHRYDPEFTWDVKEEKKVVGKVCFAQRLPTA